MPFKTLDTEQWRKAFRRALLVGPPNSWKTSSLFTWPRPMGILSFPGEQGAASIQPQEGVDALVWETDVTAKANPGAVLKEVRQATVQMLATKNLQTFAGDGLHKFYGLVYEAKFAELTDSYPQMDEDRLRGRAFGLAHEEFLKYVQLVTSSAVPYVVFTSWAGRDKDNPEDPKSMSHVWPDLPGQLAVKIMGEFGCVLYAEPGQQVAPGKFSAGTWQTRKHGKVWGAGIKVPSAVATKVPTTVPQDWRHLEGLITGDTKTGTQAPTKPAA